MSFIIRSSLSPSIPRDGLNFWLDAQNHPNLGNSDIATDRTANYVNFSINNSGNKVTYNTDGGGSFDFQGSVIPAIYIKTPINITTSINTITWVLWFKRNTTPADLTGLFFNRTTGATAGVHFGSSGNTTKLRYTWNNQHSTVETNLNTPFGIWTFCAVSVRSNGATFTMITATGSKSTFSHTNVTNPVLTFTSSFLGWDGTSGGRFLNGAISQAFFYTRDLSDIEIQDIYDSTISRHYPLGLQTTTTTTTTTTTSTTTSPPVFKFDGRASDDLSELCDVPEGGSPISLWSSKSWASLDANDNLFEDDTLQTLFQQFQYFFNDAESEYVQIDKGNGKIQGKPASCK